MAEITQVLTLRDNVTNPIMRMYSATMKLIGGEDRAVAKTNSTATALNNMSAKAQNVTSAGMYPLASATNEVARAEQVATMRATELSSALNGLGNSTGGAKIAMSELASTGGKVPGIFGALKSGLGSTMAMFAGGNIMAGAITKGIQLLAEMPGKIMTVADTYNGINARLRLITGSEEEAAKMNDMIFQSAIRARGSYETMADSVGKIALNARAAFPDPKEVVPFVEGVQKLFAIGGTDVQQQQAAMLQLTQALGSGRLQGDEFRSISEAAPMIEQMAAKYMGVEQGQLKQLASDGKLTADILKKAILANSKEIDDMFQKAPMTFAQAFTVMGTIFDGAMKPVYDSFSKFASGEFMQGLISAVTVLAPIFAGFFSFLVSGISFVLDMFVTIGDVFLGIAEFIYDMSDYIAGAVAGIAVVWAILNASMIAHSILQGLIFLRTQLIKGAMLAWRGVMMAVTGAQWLLNAALTANPIGLIIMLVAVVIGCFVAWAVKTKGLRNIMAETFRAIGNIVSTSVNFMIDCLNKALGMLNKIALGVNNVFGTHLGQIKLVGHIDENLGDKMGDWAKNVDIKGTIANSPVGKLLSGGVGGGSQGIASVPSAGGGGGGGGGGENKAERETADNTKAMADQMGIMDEDLKFMRDIAEREAIDQYTTAKVEINLGGVSQNISNGVDADGVITHLVEKLNEAVISGSEAVHT